MLFKALKQRVFCVKISIGYKNDTDIIEIDIN